MIPPIKTIQIFDFKFEIDFHHKKMWSYHYKPVNYPNKIWFISKTFLGVLEFFISYWWSIFKNKPSNPSPIISETRGYRKK